MDKILDYYTEQGVMTDPGEVIYLYKALPDEISNLVSIIQGVMVHVYHDWRYDFKIHEERKQEVNIRRIEERLVRILELNNEPLTKKRNIENRVIGSCRDFSIFLCSFLRSKGIPARVRCGFATYFTPGFYEDHWICEYRDREKERWVKVDAQLDDIQKNGLNIEFNSLDLPEEVYLTAGEVWELSKEGEVDPDICGIFDLKGWWFIMGNIVRDFMALNKFELLPWDTNELMPKPEDNINADEMSIFDEIANITSDVDAQFPHMRELFDSDKRFRMIDYFNVKTL